MKRISKFLARSKTEKESVITSYDHLEENDLTGLYDTFLKKISEGIYGQKLNAQIEVLSEGREKFLQLPAEEKCAVLMEILHLFQCNVVLANLNKIGGGAHAGSISIPFNATKQEGLTLVTQSVTGFFERRIPLVPFRPLVDRCVLQQPLQEFGPAEKHVVAAVLHQTVTAGGRRVLAGQAVSLGCRWVLEAMETGETDGLREPWYEV